MLINFATQSTSQLHIGIIMDGNGRWASERGLPRVEGHRAGAGAVRRAVRAAARLGVSTLTLYAFSSDNWKRPPHEVNALMNLFDEFLSAEVPALEKQRIRLNIIGRRDRLSPALRSAISRAEAATRQGDRMLLRIAIDYSSRDAIVGAACLGRGNISGRDEFSKLIATITHADRRPSDVDILIRTGREKRLSDFLLWESAYAELFFSSKLWPDFSGSDLRRIIASFNRRDRRFGSVRESAPQPTEASAAGGAR